jgi:hypothetical protein
LLISLTVAEDKNSILTRKRCCHLSDPVLSVRPGSKCPNTRRDQGRKELFNLHNKIHDDCFNHETLMSLFDTYISCILSYGCETWGSHKGEDIEKVHLNFLKRNLKVRMSAVNFIVYFELGRVPMYVERYYRMLKYWCKILKTEKIVLKTLL